ncbi:kynurenine formamidase isoform X3 [Opisthocomus hoazin]|uniref:kynurenine formamidase isoform X3 n=1 Tax=Opisthocomus hoazin TaxID=30419 RepID=UPI003F536437
MEGWRGMSAEALERQYSPSRWSPRLGSDAVLRAHLAATAAGTQRARAGARTSLHVPYGTGPGEQLDIYLPAEPSGPFSVLVYIHGGYWQCLSKDESGFAAPPLVSRGVGVVAVGYDTAPHGHMDAMVRQVRRSIAFLAERYSGARSCAGERHLRPRAHPAHLRERCAEHEPGGRPEEQPHAVHPPRSACGQRGACGCGPARLPGVSPAVAGVRPGAACRRLGRLPARPRWRGSL